MHEYLIKMNKGNSMIDFFFFINYYLIGIRSTCRLSSGDNGYADKT